jgi:hypothetical protein
MDDERGLARHRRSLVALVDGRRGPRLRVEHVYAPSTPVDPHRFIQRGADRAGACRRRGIRETATFLYGSLNGPMRNSIGTRFVDRQSCSHRSPTHHDASAVIDSGIPGSSRSRTRHEHAAISSRSDSVASKSVCTTAVTCGSRLVAAISRATASTTPRRSRAAVIDGGLSMRVTATSRVAGETPKRLAARNDVHSGHRRS